MWHITMRIKGMNGAQLWGQKCVTSFIVVALRSLSGGYDDAWLALVII
jgi:hypothetical protein